ncbi:MAG: GAF domain-containing protein, partial [Alkalinema sp. RL_2_19]|nr:GAF domain-containing protein [Alkalinema sp. RL_2_19]
GSILSGCLIVGLAAWYTFQGNGLFLSRAGNLELGLTDFQSWSTVILAISLVTGAAVQERQSLVDQMRANSRGLSNETSKGEVDRLLNDVSNRIRQSLNIEAILQQTVEEVRQLLNADRVCLYQVQPDGYGAVTAESVIAPWASLANERIPPDIIALQQQIYREQPIQVRDNVNKTELPQFFQQYYERYNVQSSLTISLFYQGDHLGLLGDSTMPPAALLASPRSRSDSTFSAPYRNGNPTGESLQRPAKPRSQHGGRGPRSHGADADQHDRIHGS